jgi:subtilisin family serine protease
MKATIAATALLTALLTTLASTVAAPAAAMPPAVPARAGMVEAVVVFRSQVDPGAIHVRSRRQRQVAIVRALRSRAAADQTGVLDLLRRRQAQGLVTETKPLWVVNAIAVTAAPSVIGELAARPEVREIDPDRSIQAPPASPAAQTSLAIPVEPNVDAVNAPALWNLGYTGQGTVVATMDTGVDGSHPDLAANWRGGTNSWYDPNGEHPTVPTDVNGHGTSTMGVIVGGSSGGTSIGVAPAARWIAVKIFNDRGTATTSRIHQGFQWLLDPDGNPATADAPDVVNNSWTGATAGCNLDFQPDLRNLRAAGIMPVFSAGNYGPAPSTVLSPANNPEALAVGAVDDAGVVDPSSGRGPSACGQQIAPRLVAPGVGVHTTDLYGGYLDASGTSLAAPHVTGTIALLLSAFPDLGADRTQAALESTAADLGDAGPDNTYGYGRVDALAGYQWLATAPDFSVAVTPAEATTLAGGTVSYTVSVAAIHGFTGDVALSLSGLSAGQATATVTPPVVTGGTGTARIDVATSASIPPGGYPLTVTATGGGLTRTAPARLTVSPPPDFAVAATPSSRSAVAGSAAAFTMTVTGVNGFAGVVTPTVAGLPAAVGSASFSPSTVAGSGSTTLTIATPASAPPGQYPLTITGTSGSTAHSTGVTLVVTPPPDFSVTAAPASASVLRRQTAAYTITTAPIGAFTGTVALSVTGVPTGSSASFSPNPAAVPGTSGLRVTTTGQTPRGTFTLRVNATSGTITHQTTVTLVVR